MPNNFSQLRCVDLSTAFYFETAFASGWTGVNVVKGYPNFPAVVLPVIAVRINSVNTELLEIGSRQTDDLYNIIIDIFAKSDGQKLDLAQYVKNLILADWVYYEWSRGSGETMDKSANGKIVYSGFIQDSPLLFGENFDVTDKYRYNISVNVRVAKNV